MARAPNAKASKAEELYREGSKLVDIAKKLDVPPGTVRRWKSTYNWDGSSKKKQSERSEKQSERSERKDTSTRGGQPGNANAIKNATYAKKYWASVSESELSMMLDMPTDEEFQLIETLRLAGLREMRYLALIARYQKLLETSPDGMVLKEDVKSIVEENVKGTAVKTTGMAQQTKIDGIEQMQIIEAELTRVQKIKLKAIETLAKLRLSKEKIKNTSEQASLVESSEVVNIYIPDNGRG